jgi:futalosine hydrolase
VVAVNLLLCVATEFEGALLRERLDGSHPDVAIVRTGVGPVNAAHAVTLFLATTGAREIVVCGVGGAYPMSGLHVGDVVCAASECYGDLGATSPSGFLDMKALGFPVVDAPIPLFNDIPMHVFPVALRVPFVTVSSCTGTDGAARDIETRTAGAVENMEGAAIAHVAHLHAAPDAAEPPLSHTETKRDTPPWRLKEAAAAAQEAVLSWIPRR